MSNFIATVCDIQNCDSLHLIKFSFYDIELCVISLELNKDIVIDKKVYLSVKPTNIIISKNETSAISCSNKIKVKIYEITNGKILANVKLKYMQTNFESIISSMSLQKMNLNINDEVEILINNSDISILEVCND